MTFRKKTRTASEPLVLYQVSVSRPLVFSLLFFIFALAYLLPPYWALAFGVWPKAALAFRTALGVLGEWPVRIYMVPLGIAVVSGGSATAFGTKR